MPRAERQSGNTGGMSNPSYVSLRAMMSEREATLAAATARRNQLQSDLAQLASRQSTEPGLAAEQTRLTRDYDVLKQQYDQLLANREQVRLRQRRPEPRPARSRINVVEPPSVPSVPAAPNRPIFLTVVLILGLGAGVAAAFVAGQLQTTFPTQIKLAEVTGLPVLGTVSEVVTAPERVRRRQRLIWLGGAGAALGGELGGADRGRILAAKLGGMRNEMKHTPQSLLERAAELYDFGAALRAPAPVAAPEAAPVAEAKSGPVPEAVAEAPRALRVVRAVEPPPAPPRPLARWPKSTARALAAAGFIVADGPASGLAEEFRLIKHQLLADLERSANRSILICSAQPKAGKTFCAINLALSLAGEKGVDVLLVDGDFLKPDALSQLGIDGGPGFVDALADPSVSIRKSFVIRTDVPGLSVLPAGRKTNNVPELLASDRTREVLAKLDAGDRRRIVLFDSPPVLMASHATVLAGHVGQVLVVVRADQTTEADLRETIGLLSGCGRVGLVLNGAGLAVTGRKFGAYDGYGHDQ